MKPDHAAGDFSWQLEAAMFAKIPFHKRAGRIYGLRPDLKRPRFALLLVRIGARIAGSFEQWCSLALTAFPRAKAQPIAYIVAAYDWIVAAMAEDHEAAGCS